MQNQQGSPSPAPSPAPAKAPAAVVPPKFTITGNNPRELMLNLAQLLLKDCDAFVTRETNRKATSNRRNQAPPSYYSIFSLNDGPDMGGYNDGIGLTADEAKKFPTERGVPIVFSGSFVLRQLTPLAALQAKITERTINTATRQTNNAVQLPDDVLLAEIERRRLLNPQQ